MVTTTNCDQTAEVLNIFSQSLQGLKDGKRVSYRGVGALVALTLVYMHEQQLNNEVTIEDEVFSFASESESSFYAKACEKYVTYETEVDIPDLVTRLSENIRRFISFSASCNAKKVAEIQENPKFKNLQDPLVKALEVTAVLKIFCRHTTEIFQWAKDNQCDVYAYKKVFQAHMLGIFVTTLHNCEHIIQQAQDGRYIVTGFLSAVQDKIVFLSTPAVPPLQKKGGLYMTNTTCEFTTTEAVIDQIIEGVHYQIADVMDDHEEFAVIEEHYGKHICLTGPGVAVINFEYSEDLMQNALIFIITNEINIYATEFGLSLVATVENRAQLIHWLTENLDDYGTLTEEKKDGFSTYDDVTNLLNALS